MALSKALDGIQAAATRLETERAKLVIQSQELQIWDMAREEELVLLRAENEQLEQQLAMVSEKISKGLGRDGVLDSLQFALRKARHERDAEVREADALFNQLQEAKAAAEELREVRAAFVAALSNVSDDWSAIPLLSEEARQLRAQADAAVKDPTNMSQHEMLTLLRGLLALAGRASELERENQTLRGEKAALQLALDAAQQELAEQAQQLVQPGLAGTDRRLPPTRDADVGTTERRTASSSLEAWPRGVADAAKASQEQHLNGLDGAVKRGGQQHEEVVAALRRQVTELEGKVAEYRSFLMDNQEEIESLQIELKQLRQAQQAGGAAATIHAGPTASCEPKAGTPTDLATSASARPHSSISTSAQAVTRTQVPNTAVPSAAASLSSAERHWRQAQQQQQPKPQPAAQQPLPVAGTPTRHVVSSSSPISTVNYGASPGAVASPSARGSPGHHPQPVADIAVKVAELQELALRAQQQAAEHEDELLQQHHQELASLRYELTKERASEMAALATQLTQQHAAALADVQARERELAAQHAAVLEQAQAREAELAQQHKQAVQALEAEVARLVALQAQMEEELQERTARLAEQHAAALVEREREVQAGQEVQRRLAEREAELQAQAMQAMAEQAERLARKHAEELRALREQLEEQSTRDLRELEERLGQQLAAQERELEERLGQQLVQRERELRQHLEQQHAEHQARREAEARDKYAERLAEQAAQLARLHAEEAAALGVEHAERLADRESQLQAQFEQQLAELRSQLAERERDLAASHQNRLVEMEVQLQAQFKQRLADREAELQSRFDQEMVERERDLAAAHEARVREVEARGSGVAEEREARLLEELRELRFALQEQERQLQEQVSLAAGAETAAEQARRAHAEELERVVRAHEEELQQREDDWRRQLEKRSVQIEELRQAIDDWRGQLEERSSQVEELRWRMEEAQAVAAKETAAAAAEAAVWSDALRQELRQKEEELQAEQERAVVQKERQEELEAELAELRSAVERAAVQSERLEELEAEVVEARAAVERAERVRQEAVAAVERQCVEVVARLGREHEQATAEARSVHELRESNLRKALERQAQEAREAQRNQEARLKEMQAQVAELRTLLARERESHSVVSDSLKARVEQLATELEAARQEASQRAAGQSRERAVRARTSWSDRRLSETNIESPPAEDPDDGPPLHLTDSPDRSLFGGASSRSATPATAPGSQPTATPLSATHATPSSTSGPGPDIDKWIDGQDLVWPQDSRTPSSDASTSRPGQASFVTPASVNSLSTTAPSLMDRRGIPAAAAPLPPTEGSTAAFDNAWNRSSGQDLAPRLIRALRDLEDDSAAPGGGGGVGARLWGVSLELNEQKVVRRGLLEADGSSPMAPPAASPPARSHAFTSGAHSVNTVQTADAAAVMTSVDKVLEAAADRLAPFHTPNSKPGPGPSPAREPNRTSDDEWGELVGASDPGAGDDVPPLIPSPEPGEVPPLEPSSSEPGGYTSEAATSVSTTSSYDSKTEFYVDDEDDDELRGRALAAALALSPRSSQSMLPQTLPPPPAVLEIQQRRRSQSPASPPAAPPPSPAGGSSSPREGNAFSVASAGADAAGRDSVSNAETQLADGRCEEGGHSGAGGDTVMKLEATFDGALPPPRQLAPVAKRPRMVDLLDTDVSDEAGSSRAVSSASPRSDTHGRGLNLEATLRGPFPALLPPLQATTGSLSQGAAQSGGFSATAPAGTCGQPPALLKSGSFAFTDGSRDVVGQESSSSRALPTLQQSGSFAFAGLRLDVDNGHEGRQASQAVDSSSSSGASSEGGEAGEESSRDGRRQRSKTAGGNQLQTGHLHGVGSPAASTDTSWLSDDGASAAAPRDSQSRDSQFDGHRSGEADADAPSAPTAAATEHHQSLRRSSSGPRIEEAGDGSGGGSGGGYGSAAGGSISFDSSSDSSLSLPSTARLSSSPRVQPAAERPTDAAASGSDGEAGALTFSPPSPGVSSLGAASSWPVETGVGFAWGVCTSPREPGSGQEDDGSAAGRALGRPGTRVVPLMAPNPLYSETGEPSPPWSVADWGTPRDSVTAQSEEGSSSIPSTPGSDTGESSGQGESSGHGESDGGAEAVMPSSSPLLGLESERDVDIPPLSRQDVDSLSGDGSTHAGSRQTPTDGDGGPSKSADQQEDRGDEPFTSSSGGVASVQRQLQQDVELEEDDTRSLLAAGATLGSSERRRRQRRRMGDAPPLDLHPMDLLRQSWEFVRGVAMPISPRSPGPAAHVAQVSSAPAVDIVAAAAAATATAAAALAVSFTAAQPASPRMREDQTQVPPPPVSPPPPPPAQQQDTSMIPLRALVQVMESLGSISPRTGRSRSSSPLSHRPAAAPTATMVNVHAAAAVATRPAASASPRSPEQTPAVSRASDDHFAAAAATTDMTVTADRLRSAVDEGGRDAEAGVLPLAVTTPATSLTRTPATVASTPNGLPSSTREARQRSREVLSRAMSRVADLEEQCRALAAASGLPAPAHSPSSSRTVTPSLSASLDGRTYGGSSTGSPPPWRGPLHASLRASAGRSLPPLLSPPRPPGALRATAHTALPHQPATDNSQGGDGSGNGGVVVAAASVGGGGSDALALPGNSEQDRAAQIGEVMSPLSSPVVAAEVIGALEDLRGDLFELEHLHLITTQGSLSLPEPEPQPEALLLLLPPPPAPTQPGAAAAAGTDPAEATERVPQGGDGDGGDAGVAASAVAQGSVHQGVGRPGSAAAPATAASQLPGVARSGPQPWTTFRSQPQDGSLQRSSPLPHPLEPGPPAPPSSDQPGTAPPSAAGTPLQHQPFFPAGSTGPSPGLGDSGSVSGGATSASLNPDPYLGPGSGSVSGGGASPASLDPALFSLLQASIQAQVQGQLGALQAKIEELQRQNQALLMATTAASTPATPLPGDLLLTRGSVVSEMRWTPLPMPSLGGQAAGEGEGSIGSEGQELNVPVALASWARGEGGGDSVLRWGGRAGPVGVGLGGQAPDGAGSSFRTPHPSKTVEPGGLAGAAAGRASSECTPTASIVGGGASPAQVTGLALGESPAEPYSPEQLSQLPPTVQLFAPPQLRAAALAAAHQRRTKSAAVQQR